MKLINLANIITCGNIICGCLSIVSGLYGFIDLACLFILGGAFFDYFDGMTARALGISGPIGKELDSLADMVSFGIAPGVLAFRIFESIIPQEGTSVLIAFLIPSIMVAFSGLRLAKFNCDERQTLSFIGLPTPANALFWIGMTYLMQFPQIQSFCIANSGAFQLCFALLIVAISYLLISELPMFSLKIKPGHNGFAENKARYIFLVLVVVILVLSSIAEIKLLFASPAIIILLYIILSIIDVKFLSKK